MCLETPFPSQVDDRTASFQLLQRGDDLRLAMLASCSSFSLSFVQLGSASTKTRLRLGKDFFRYAFGVTEHKLGIEGQDPGSLRGAFPLQTTNKSTQSAYPAQFRPFALPALGACAHTLRKLPPQSLAMSRSE